MKQEDILNLLAEHHLSIATLDFLEQIKFKKYDRESLDKFSRIAYVNNNAKLQKKIHESQYEMGFCKVYPLLATKEESPASRGLADLNRKRISTRSFGAQPVTLQEISSFLQLFYTLTGCETHQMGQVEIKRDRRNIASGGALYPTEIYVINHRIPELPLGGYRYNVLDFTLEQIKTLDTLEELEEFYSIIMKSATASIDFERTSAFVVFTSVLNKHSFKYKDYGVVLSLIELGEFVHAAYLAGAALNLGCCTFGGILSNQMNQWLELKNSLHQPFLCMAIGHVKEEDYGTK